MNASDELPAGQSWQPAASQLRTGPPVLQWKPEEKCLQGLSGQKRQVVGEKSRDVESEGEKV